MRSRMQIYCCGCCGQVDAILTNGKDIYPHRSDLHALPLWKCPGCGLHVGCHHKTNDPTRPLGVIATPEIKNARRHIHNILDPLWKSGRIKRKEVYAKLGQRLGYAYHTAEIKEINEARRIYREVQKIATETE